MDTGPGGGPRVRARAARGQPGGSFSNTAGCKERGPVGSKVIYPNPSSRILLFHSPDPEGRQGTGLGGADQLSKAAFLPLALYFSAPASFCSLAFHSSLLTAILSPSECPLGTVCLQGSEWLLSVIPQSLVGHLRNPASFY